MLVAKGYANGPTAPFRFIQLELHFHFTKITNSFSVRHKYANLAFPYDSHSSIHERLNIPELTGRVLWWQTLGGSEGTDSDLRPICLDRTKAGQFSGNIAPDRPHPFAWSNQPLHSPSQCCDECCIQAS